MTTQPISLPAMPAGLTADWLSELLMARGVLPADVRIADVTRSQVGAGIGMMSELARLTLTYTPARADLPRTLIAKFPSRNPTNRQIAMDYRLYERETRYFGEIDPHTSAITPECYVSARDGDNFIILMEDLGDYRTGSQAAGATLEDAEAAIDALAKLHAPFWNQVDDLAWVPHVANSFHATNMHALAMPGWDNMQRIFGDLIPEHIERRRDHFLGAIPTLQARMDTTPVTLTHGDFRLDNLLFGVRPDHHPVAIIDWQGPLICRGVFDVALLLGQNTRVEVRRAHERALLERYVAGLAALGVDYPFEVAWEHYVEAQLYDWTYAAVVSGALDSSNPETMRWMRRMIERQVAVTEDLDLMSRLPGLAVS